MLVGTSSWTSMSESIFDTLPDELVEFILAKADVDDILGFLQVATRFRQIILQSTHLQYLIELAADGLEDGSSSELCFADRLQALRQRRAARATLEPTARRTVTCDGTGRRVAFGSHLVWYRAETSEICILQIPSVFRAIPEKEWTVQGPSVTGELLHSLTIDPNQDLLVTLIVGQDGQKLGIRSLSTGGHHPVAATPILYIDRVPWEESEFKVEEIYVSNNYLGFRLVFGDHRWVMKEQIMVYDWTSGRHILSVSQEAARAGIGFTFLTDQYLLLVYSGTQDDNYEFKFVLSVIDMNSLPSGNTTEMVISELQPTCSLLLPLLPAVPPSPIEINVNTHHPWHTTHMRLPFLCPSDDRLVAITLSWSRLTTRLHTILDFVARAKSDPAKRVFGWDEWGKDRCRLVEDRFKESASVSGVQNDSTYAMLGT
ncbi:hypothetical protein BXZ70DRAFT_762318 [Cristinia sonorae]|uniref:F-box domain-containing protein n=1 Tax=Cristinia sonorae TaxID=1940300 RepID=A0A8K0XRV2_9AGAR|nr:hypothetical protein BXZ70DRAFT_762318 [Cristinia sonorae]